MAKFTFAQKLTYNLKRSRVGATDRNGQPLSDFIRGKYAGKAQAMKTQAAIYGKKKVKSSMPKKKRKLSDFEIKYFEERDSLKDVYGRYDDLPF